MEPLGEGEDDQAGSELIAYAEAATAPADFKKPRRLTDVAMSAPFQETFSDSLVEPLLFVKLDNHLPCEYKPFELA